MDNESESLVLDADIVDQEGSIDDNIQKVVRDGNEQYQIRPPLEEKFKPIQAREIIHTVLFDQLSEKEYDKDEAKTWAMEIATIIRDKLKKLEYTKYKYVVNVNIGSQTGAGVKVGNRCFWDTETDTCAFDSFTSESLFCVVAVYAIYTY